MYRSNTRHVRPTSSCLPRSPTLIVLIYWIESQWSVKARVQTSCCCFVIRLRILPSATDVWELGQKVKWERSLRQFQVNCIWYFDEWAADAPISWLTPTPSLCPRSCTILVSGNFNVSLFIKDGREGPKQLKRLSIRPMGLLGPVHRLAGNLRWNRHLRLRLLESAAGH